MNREPINEQYIAPTPLTFNQYEETVVSTELYHSSIDRFIQTLNIPYEEDRKSLYKLLSTLYVTIGMLGEAGEIAEKVKKIIRDKNCMVSDNDKVLLQKEVGDVLWYNGALAKELDSTLEDVAQQNIEKLLLRKAKGMIKGSGDTREQA